MNEFPSDSELKRIRQELDKAVKEMEQDLSGNGVEMSIKTPVFREGRIVFSAEHFPLFRLAEVLDDSVMDEVVRSINLLPQFIAKLEEARDFIDEEGKDQGYRIRADICLEIDALLAQAKV